MESLKFYKDLIDASNETLHELVEDEPACGGNGMSLSLIILIFIVSDCLHLQLYRDSKDRYKQGQTKASLSLQHFLGVESGFTLDKESNTIAIICQDVTVILAFDTRERLIQWQVKISNNLGDDQQFLIQITSAPPKAKIASGPARIHVLDQRFCITTGVPPRLVGFWEIGQLRRYGVVEGRFCFEGGSRCGKGEGLHVCVTDQGEEITNAFSLAAQGKLVTRRRPVTRKMSAMDSPRKQLHSRAETRISDLSCAETFQQQQVLAELSRSMCSEDICCSESVHDSSRHPSAEDLLCPCRLHHGSSSPFWSSAESAAGHHNTDLDSNYGCGDTASVSELPDPHYHHPDSGWPVMASDGSGPIPSLERCASCISKLGAPSMSRSSTATNTNTPTVPFSPAWTMDGVAAICHHHAYSTRSNAGSSGCDRVSISSHGSSGNSEYCVPRFSTNNPPEACWYDRPRTVLSNNPPPPHAASLPPVPPKSPKTSSVPSSSSGHPPSLSHTNKPYPVPATDPCRCQCCPPSRPPKPPQMSAGGTPPSTTDSPSKKKIKKPPMPLPLPTPQPMPINQQPICTCHHHPAVIFHQPQQQAQPPQRPDSSLLIGPYENYDVPKSLLGSSYSKDSREEAKLADSQNRLSLSAQPSEEYYDTPKNIRECLAISGSTDPAVNPQYGNYDTPPTMKTLRKACGCIIKYAKKSVVVTSSVESTRMVVEHEDVTADCPCQRVMCWAENWMMLPYCRRGNGMENTGVPIHKVKLSGEGKMPVVNASGEIAIYATVDKSKKTNRKGQLPCSCSASSANHGDECLRPEHQSECANYVNVEPGTEVVNTSDSSMLVPSAPNSDSNSVGANYQNIDFAHSLEYYENSKDVLQRAGISQQEIDNMASELSSESSRFRDDSVVSYTISNGVKFCNKCGHACHVFSPVQQHQQPPNPDMETSTLSESLDSNSNKQDDYLMMEPAKTMKTPQGCASESSGQNYPGYLPMSPITSGNTACNKTEVLKLKVDHHSAGLPSEKAASIPSLAAPIAPAVDRSRKRSEVDFPRVPGSAMMYNSANSPYLRRLLMESNDEVRRQHLLSRKRSSSADSSRYLDEFEDFEGNSVTERGISLSQTKLSTPECSRKSPVVIPASSETSPKKSAEPQVEIQPTPPVTGETKEEIETTETERNEPEEAVVAVENLTDDGSTSSGSLRTLIRECLVDPQQQQQGISQSAVHIRRSSSVPCKSGNNRDSSSSNDSGVSTGSLKHRGADFAEFELPLTTAMSTRRHHHAVSRHPGALTNCLHASLPRRSKSVDPLREISFQFQKIKIPAKSSSAEAEVPICPTKRDGTKGFQSPGGDGAMVVPYMDSRSTSSGTSDMSDYIETLSLSSHSSSDTPDSLRLGRPATTTLRPRSGKEYQLIDRSILDGDMKPHCTVPEKSPHQLRGLVAPYANITPVPEKSESPSPGYMSGSPGQEREDQPHHTLTYPATTYAKD
ncbi:uncharacterized protein [Anabrus simplex]|uniref:uncharacterized protein n=1 Tax=Anabrus simplex TaxID=316456 RepID=UPI0035A34ACD